MTLEEAVRQIVDARIGEIVGPSLDWASLAVVAAELGLTEKALRTRIGRGWLDPKDVSREGRRVFLRRSAVARRIERGAG